MSIFDANGSREACSPDSPRKRRLVVITEIISPYRIPVFNALAESQEIDLHVIFLAETDTTQRQWLVYKEEMRFSYEVLPSFRRRIAGNNILLNWGMGRALSRVSPEVIVCGGYNYLAAWRALAWSRLEQVPLLLWVESNRNDQRSGLPLVERLKRTFLRRCSAFIAAGKSSREYLIAYGIPTPIIFSAPNAVGNSVFSSKAEAVRKNPEAVRRALNLPSRYFLSVGRLVPEKGMFDLLDAYSALAPELKSQVALLFVGDGPERAELMRRIAKINSGTVILAGFVQRDDLAVYYGLADVFVFPTHSDPWGLVVNEAMACGLPIVATNVAGCVADLVKDGQNGFVTKLRDITALRDAMAQLAEDTQLRKRMSAASLQIIASFAPADWARGVVNAVLASEGIASAK